ncbi:MAG TPA: amino acid ABC transporter permease [Lachnospiraceae bacterium]
MNLSIMLKQLISGMAISTEIFVLTLIFSLPLGLLVCFGRMSKFTPLRWISSAYISVMRGTPLMLQLMVVYFGPYFLFGIKITKSYSLSAVLIGFAINYAAYFAEIYRGGIASMPVGQYEAAKILGYNRVQTFLHIILPQVIKRVLPSITNEVITLVKDTSLAFVLAVSEMFTIAKQIASAQTTMMPFVIAAVFYYVFNLIVAVLMNALEKKMNYYR